MDEIRYYEIENTVSEWDSTVTARYLTLDEAKEGLKNCCDWFMHKGTGTIYEVIIKRGTDDSRLNYSRNRVYRSW